MATRHMLKVDSNVLIRSERYSHITSLAVQQYIITNNVEKPINIRIANIIRK